MKAGQGILLRLNYADGSLADKARTFLVVSNDNIKISLLNVSSIRGKAHKLMYRSNKKIINYKPPFMKPSFVKLDAEYVIDYSSEMENFILHDGKAIRPDELLSISQELDNYRGNQDFKVAYTCIDNVMILNQVTVESQVASTINEYK